MATQILSAARRRRGTFATLLVIAALAVGLALVTLPPLVSAAPASHTMVTEMTTVTEEGPTQLIASCPAGYHVTGGGYEVGSIDTSLFVHQDFPVPPDVNPSGRWGWGVTLVNPHATDEVEIDFWVHALCERG